MRAAFITGHGGNEVVSVGQRPEPERSHGDVLIRVEAATLNRVDLYMRDSGAGITHSLPQIMGLDAFGTVETVGGDERRLKPGQKVVVYAGIFCGRCEFCHRGNQTLCTEVQYLGEHRDGTLSEFICLPAENVLPAPEGLAPEEAAALGVNHLTAWGMITGKARMQPWETALIFGIGGGVSLAALQIIKAMGGTAIVTSREDNKLARAQELGADHVINSAREDVAARVLALTGKRGVDVVIENVGEAVWPLAMKSLVRGGRLVTCGATSGDHPSADLRRLFIRQLQIFGSTMASLGEYRDLLTFVAKHRLRPIIDSRFGLGETHAALDRLESGQQFGKVAIEIAR